MGETVALTVQGRNVSGKKVRQLRREGYVPAVLYGRDFPARNIMAPVLTITKAVGQAGKHHPVELQLDGATQLAMIKTIDVDPVKHQLRHVALQVIKQDEEVETEVPIVIVDAGQTPAEKAGLVVLTTIETVQVKALPASLPDQLELPGDKMTEVGSHVTVADVIVPKGVTLLSDPEQVVATVYEPSALQAANEAAGGGAEPGDEEVVAADAGSDTPQETQAEEDRPGGKKQFEPKGE